MDYFQRFVFETDQYNPIALAWDGMSGYISGKDRYGNSLSGTQSTVKMLSAIPITKVGSVTSKATTAIWSSTKKISSVKNAFGHWKKHAAEFPEFANAKQYVEGTKNFLHNSPTGTLIKTRANGDMLKYHPGTNTFGVMEASGVPKTMFRPTDGMDYWLKQ